METFSDVVVPAGIGVSNAGVPPRSRNWNPPGPPDDRPIVINARLVEESTTTPQFSHSPPEKCSSAVALLDKVLVRVVPLIRYTSVLLPTHTVSPVVELDEHELGMFPVVIEVAAPPVPSPLLVSIGKTLTLAVPVSQLPWGR